MSEENKYHLQINKTLPEIIKEKTLVYKGLINSSSSAVDFIDQTCFVLSHLYRNPTLHTESVEFKKYIPELKHRFLEEVLNEAATLINVRTLNYYLTNTHTNYKLAADFYNKFKNIDLKNIRFSDIQAPTNCYIKLPFPLKDYDGDEFTDCFVYIGPSDDMAGFNKQEHIEMTGVSDTSDKILSINLFNKKTSVAQCTFFPNDLSMPLESLIRHLPSYKNWLKRSFTGDMSDWFRELCKVLVYIQSRSPDIRSFKNSIKYRTPTSTKISNSSKHLSLEEISLVGYGWKKDRIRHTDHSLVEGHFRWQRHGKEFSQVKLIWIDDHQRHYNNTPEDSTFPKTKSVQHLRETDAQ